MDSRNEYQKFCDDLSPYSKTKIGDKTFINPDEEKLKEKMKIFYSESKKQSTDRVSSLNDILSGNFVLGENHNNISPKKFLIANMQKLKESGFDTLFLEHLYYDDQQLLNDCLEKKEVDQETFEKLYYLDTSFRPRGKEYKDLYKEDSGSELDDWDLNNYTSLVFAAIEAGIRVVAIDTLGSYQAQFNHKESYGGLPTSKDKDNFRLESMNFTAARIIQETIKAGKCKKWFALVGNAHVSTCQGVTGLAELMGAHTVSIVDATTDLEVKLNTSHEVRKTETPVDVLIRMNYKDSPPELKFSAENASLLASNKNALFGSSAAEGSPKEEVKTTKENASIEKRPGS